MHHLRISSLGLAATLLGCAPTATTREPAPGTAVVSGSVSYRCESGRKIEASYTANSAAVTFEGRTREMTVATSASGARYVGDGYEWWTKGTGPGSSGTLFLQEPGGTTGEPIEKCVMEESVKP